MTTPVDTTVDVQGFHISLVLVSKGGLLFAVMGSEASTFLDSDVSFLFAQIAEN